MSLDSREPARLPDDSSTPSARPEGETRRPLLPHATRAFALPVSVGDSSWAKKVVVGDFTGDGKPDFATLHWEIGGRCVVAGVEYKKGFLVIPHVNTTPPGAALATFTAMPGLAMISDDYRLYDMYASDIAVGDVNGNGRDDIVVANAHHDIIYIYLSNGDGTFQPPLEIAKTGDDDPSYIALGDFNGDGKLDIAVLHLRRHFPGQNFEWRLAFLFGNGDGTFQEPVTLDQGDWSFGGDNDDGGGYYKSTTFNVVTMKKSALVGGAYRDAVSLNGAMMWWDGTSIQMTLHATTQLHAPLGTSVMKHYGPGMDSFASLGGRKLLASVSLPGDTLKSTANTTMLDLAVRGHKGLGVTAEFSGMHVIVDDFDGDGLLDVLLFSDVTSDSHLGSEMFLVYGQSDVIHPLTFSSPTPVAELGRIRFFPNPGGSWFKGHRGWRAAVADFNMDGYPDILTLTSAGVLLHMNYGQRSYEGARPVIEQVFDHTPHTSGGVSGAWYQDTIQVTFRLGDARPVTGVVLRSSFPTGPVLFLKMTLDEKKPDSIGYFEVPDDLALPPDVYTVTLHNGVVESANSSQLRVLRRPLELDVLTLEEVAKGAREVRLLVRGFFGPEAELASQVTFTIDVTGAPGAVKPLRVQSLEETSATLSIDVDTGPGTHTITLVHATRGSLPHTVSIPEYKPKLFQLNWSNPNNVSHGSFIPGRGLVNAKPQPGASMIFVASLLHAPGTKQWKLLDAASKVVASGTTGVVGGIGYSNDNKQAACYFTLPKTITPGDDYRIGVTTEAGLDSDLAGPLTFEGAAPTPTPIPSIWVGIEDLAHGRTGAVGVKLYPATKFDETDPTKPKGALQQAKAEFVGLYKFTELTPTEATYPGGLNNARHWDFTGTDSKGDSVTDEVTAISVERARVDAIDEFDLVSIASIGKQMGDP